MVKSELEDKSFNVDPMIMALIKKDVLRGNLDLQAIIGDENYSNSQLMLDLNSEINKGNETAFKLYQTLEAIYKPNL